MPSKRIQAETTFSLKDDLFNEERVRELAAGLASSAQRHGVRFPRAKFVSRIVDGFATRELKQRIEWIVDVLTETLPGEFETALDLLEGALPPPLDPTRTDDDFGSFIWVAPGEFAARHGRNAEHVCQPGFGLKRLVHILVVVSVQNELCTMLNQHISHRRGIPESLPGCVLARKGRMMNQNRPKVALLAQAGQ